MLFLYGGEHQLQKDKRQTVWALLVYNHFSCFWFGAASSPMQSCRSCHKSTNYSEFFLKLENFDNKHLLRFWCWCCKKIEASNWWLWTMVFILFNCMVNTHYTDTAKKSCKKIITLYHGNTFTVKTTTDANGFTVASTYLVNTSMQFSLTVAYFFPPPSPQPIEKFNSIRQNRTFMTLATAWDL